MQLEGPEAVSQLATEVMSCLSQLPPTLRILRRWRENGSPQAPGEETPVDAWFEAHSPVNDRLDAFIEAAREAIDALLGAHRPAR